MQLKLGNVQYCIDEYDTLSALREINHRKTLVLYSCFLLVSDEVLNLLASSFVKCIIYSNLEQVRVYDYGCRIILRFYSAAVAGQARASSNGSPGYYRGRGRASYFGSRGRGRGGPQAFYQPASKVPRFGLDPNDR